MTGPTITTADLSLPRDDGADLLDLPRVVARYEAPLLRYARHLMGDVGDETQDVVQEAFLRLHRQAPGSGRGRIKDLSAWLFRVTHNLATDALRKRRRRAEAQEKLARDADESATNMDATLDMQQQETAQQAMKLLAQLPAVQQRVLMLKLTNNLSLRQIAQVLGSSHGSVALQMNQALAELARKLKQSGAI